MLTEITLRKIEDLFNYLVLDQYKNSNFSELYLKKIRLKLENISFVIFFEDNIKIVKEDDSVDLEVYISLDVLPLILLGIDDFKKKVKLNGDANVASLLNDLIENFDFNIEEKLVVFFGEFNASLITKIFLTVKSELNNFSINFKRMVAEFIDREKTLIPSKNEIENFNNSVDKIRDDVERLQQRTSILYEKNT
jgi:ubiquinone biosynthesis protein UbiJ